MRIYNRYIISLALACSVTNTMLALFGQKDVAVYSIINILVYLVITLLYVYFNPRARRALNSISAVLFAGFMVVVALKAMEILSH